MTALDQRMEELLGPMGELHDCDTDHIFLEFNEPTARAIVDALRWALYGGARPPGARRALVAVLDGIVLGLSDDKLQGCATSYQQAEGRTI